MTTHFPGQGRRWGQHLHGFKMRTACSYCLVGNTQWWLGVQKFTSSALFLKPSGTTMPCEQQQKTFALLSTLELPYGGVWILSQHYTLPPQILQKGSALQTSPVGHVFHSGRPSQNISVLSSTGVFYHLSGGTGENLFSFRITQQFCVRQN